MIIDISQGILIILLTIRFYHYNIRKHSKKSMNFLKASGQQPFPKRYDFRRLRVGPTRKKKSSAKDFFSKCEHIRSFLKICSHSRKNFSADIHQLCICQVYLRFFYLRLTARTLLVIGKFIVCTGVSPLSTPLKNILPSFLRSPSTSKSANCPSPPLFRQFPPIYQFFVTPSPPPPL